MPMERSYATFYLLEITMFPLSVADCKIFTVNMLMTITLIYRMGHDKSKFANEN